MKEVLLVCSMGISTAFIVKDMMQSAKKQNLDLNIRALAADNIDEAIEHVDIIVVAPPAVSQYDSIKEKVNGRIPVIFMDGEHYIKVNGEGLLQEVLTHLE